MKRATRQKLVVATVLILITLSSIAFYGLVVWHEYGRAAQDGRDAPSFKVYTQKQLVLGGHKYEGRADAPITIAIVVDFSSVASVQYYEEIVPQLMTQYVENGQARLYHKEYLTEDDFRQKKGNFKYAVAAACYDRNGGTDPIRFHEALFNASEDVLAGLGLEFNLTEGYASCLNTIPEEVYEEMAETRLYRLESPSIHIGLDGHEESVLVGEASLSRIDKIIRNKQVTIGI